MAGLYKIFLQYHPQIGGGVVELGCPMLCMLWPSLESSRAQMLSAISVMVRHLLCIKVADLQNMQDL